MGESAVIIHFRVCDWILHRNCEGTEQLRISYKIVNNFCKSNGKTFYM